MVDSAKSILTKVIPDVYIYTDHARGASSGKSPAFGLCLFAETTTGVVFSVEANSKPKDAEDPVAKSVSATSATPSIPEDIGQEAACRLLDEVRMKVWEENDVVGWGCARMGVWENYRGFLLALSYQFPLLIPNSVITAGAWIERTNRWPLCSWLLARKTFPN